MSMTDLHMHSFYSEDGEFSPAELVERCSRAGISVMSVTDHNCARANTEARERAEELGMRYISGIEIDCVFSGHELHALGYGIDEWSADFVSVEENVARQNRCASLERLEKIRSLGFRVEESELEALCKDAYWQGSWPGELFAELLLKKPEYSTHPLLLPYRPGGSRGDNPYVNFYWDYCAQGKPCHAKMEYPPAEEIVAVIHKNHGRAVLAHPGASLRGHGELLEKIIDLGFDGIEAISSYHSPLQAREFYLKARQRGMFATCGSDYHGKTKPAISLGGYGELPPDFFTENLTPLFQ